MAPAESIYAPFPARKLVPRPSSGYTRRDPESPRQQDPPPSARMSTTFPAQFSAEHSHSRPSSARPRPSSARARPSSARSRPDALHSLKPAEAPEGIGHLDCVNERDVPPIAPLFLPRPNLVVNGDTVLLKLKDRPDGMFLDRVFPASTDSLDGISSSSQSSSADGTNSIDAQTVSSVVNNWSRPQQLSRTHNNDIMASAFTLSHTLLLLSSKASLFGSGSGCRTLRQGALGDCWFLSALGVVASRPQLLRQLFSRFGSSGGTSVEQLMQMGVFTLQFYKDCSWHLVTVDSFLPCKDALLVFASCGDSNAFWPGIVEKAYAKLHGSYAALQGGSVADALVDLTGGVAVKWDIAASEQDGMGTDSGGEGAVGSTRTWGSKWRRLMRHNAKGHLMGCSLILRGSQEQVDNGQGILFNHAYGIMDVKQLSDSMCFIKVFDPWGILQWRGPWSSTSELWDINVAVTRALGMVMNSRLHWCADESTCFWMHAADFFQTFTRIYVCKLPPAHWSSLAIRGEWNLSTAGGSCSEPTWPFNPQFRMWCKGQAEAIIVLSQTDRRSSKHPDSHLPPQTCIGFTVWRCKPGAAPQRVWSSGSVTGCVRARGGNSWIAPALVGEARCSESREVSVTLRVEGLVLYYIVPHTLLPGVQAPFSFRIYCNSPIELHRVPVPSDTSLITAWEIGRGGGTRSSASFCDNPQVLLTTEGGEGATVMALMAVQNKTSDLGHVGGGGVGLVICEGGSSGALLEQTPGNDQVIVESDFSLPTFASCLFKLRGDAKAIAVPCSTIPGLQGQVIFPLHPFNSAHLHSSHNFQQIALQFLSDRPLRVQLLPSSTIITLACAWDKLSAGGSHVATRPDRKGIGGETFGANPHVLVKFSGGGVGVNLRATISRPEGFWGPIVHRKPLGAMLGGYIFEGSQVVQCKRDAVCLAEATFVSGHSVRLDCSVPRGCNSVVVVAATLDSGIVGPFNVKINCNVPCVAVVLGGTH